jgi:hypothetical protein
MRDLGVGSMAHAARCGACVALQFQELLRSGGTGMHSRVQACCWWLPAAVMSAVVAALAHSRPVVHDSHAPLSANVQGQSGSMLSARVWSAWECTLCLYFSCSAMTHGSLHVLIRVRLEEG